MEKNKTYSAAKVVNATHEGKEGKRTLKSPHFATRKEAVHWLTNELNHKDLVSCDHVIIHSKEYDDNGLIQKDLIEYFYEW